MKTAINIPCYQVEDLEKLPDNCVLININEENSAPYKLRFPIDERVLPVVFSDVTFSFEHKGNTINPISNSTAKNIVRFAEQNKDKNFLVNCAAGVSRSSAVCMFLHLFYGHALRKDYWNLSCPNPFVLGQLAVAYSRKDLPIEI